MSPVEFFTLPQATPSINAGQAGYGYCSPSDVASMDKALAAGVGQGNNPNLADINGYILRVAGEIDATLLKLGFDVPVNSASYPEAGALLNSINTKGAWAMWEDAAPVAPNRDRAKAAYDEALALLADAKFAPEEPADVERAGVRAPFVTYTPPQGVYDPTLEQIGGFPGDGISAAPAGDRRRLPFFSRSMRF